MRDDDAGQLTLAIEVADAELAERLAEALSGSAAIRIVPPGAAADACVVDATRPTPGFGEDLTTREREVLGLLAQGASNKLIARQLGISVHTAKFHVGRVIDKLDAVGRTDAVAHAARLGVISL